VYQIYNTNAPQLAAGCYVDSQTQRVLGNKLYTGSALSQDSCRQLAVANNYNYYGVEFGTECWADFTYAYSPAPSSACTYACSGASGQFCGGFNAIQIFPTSTQTQAPTSYVPPTQFVSPTSFATQYVQPTNNPGNKPACNTPATFYLSNSGSNAFTIQGLGDNPTLSVALNLQYTFVSNGATSGIYISQTPTYSAGSLVNSAQASVTNQGSSSGQGATSVTFNQAGTYYYTSQTNSNQHGTINVASYTCF
jgi:hypothetical protein